MGGLQGLEAHFHCHVCLKSEVSPPSDTPKSTGVGYGAGGSDPRRVGVGAARCFLRHAPGGMVLALDGPGLVPLCLSPWWPHVTQMPPGSSGGGKRKKSMGTWQEKALPKISPAHGRRAADRHGAGKCHGPRAAVVGHAWPPLWPWARPTRASGQQHPQGTQPPRPPRLGTSLLPCRS